jgi:uncharacterized protein (DUF58 family)
MPSNETDVLSADEALMLERLAVTGVRAASAPSSTGLRRAFVRGAGLEFHEYRHYQPGDDPRWIDWTVEARLRQLVVRVAQADAHLRLHVLVDTSRSMTAGSPAKLACACRLAAALCYVALERRDSAGVSAFAETIGHRVPLAGGRAQLFRILESLGSLKAEGRSRIDEALIAYASAVRGPGLAVVLSDFFDPASDLRGLRYLLHRRLFPAVVQIVSPDEVRPLVAEGTEILDLEDDARPPCAVDAQAIAAYQRRLTEHWAALRSFCVERGLPCVRIESDTAFSDMLSSIETAGLLGTA